MDIAEAESRKCETEEAILVILRDFESDTGLAVDKIRVRTVEQADGTTSLTSIKIEAKL